MIRMAILVASLVMAAPIAAQTATPVEPARLAAARALVDEIMPPAQRDAMISAMIKPMIENVRGSMAKDPRMAELVSKDPRVQSVFDRFMNRVVDEAMGSVSTGMPRMFEAMTIAYARQFSVAELNEVRAFYATPTGRSFMAKMPQIMADPAVQEAQRTLMNQSMGGMPALVKEFQAELLALETNKK